MGILGRLFGASDSGDGTDVGRCNDCGMAGGRHTDWCPTAREERASTPAAPAEEPSGDQGEQQIQA